MSLGNPIQLPGELQCIEPAPLFRVNVSQYIASFQCPSSNPTPVVSSMCRVSGVANEIDLDHLPEARSSNT